MVATKGTLFGKVGKFPSLRGGSKSVAKFALFFIESLRRCFPKEVIGVVLLAGEKSKSPCKYVY